MISFCSKIIIVKCIDVCIFGSIVFICAYSRILQKRDTNVVGTETLNLFQRSGWRPKTHSHCRINCEKLVEGWLRSRPSILISGFRKSKKVIDRLFF